MCNYIDPQVFRRSDGVRVSGTSVYLPGDPAHGALDAPEILAGGTVINVWGFLDCAYQAPIKRD